jgi:hypothetical protein
MKRILAALLLWAFVLGGLDLYMRRFEASPRVVASASSQEKPRTQLQAIYSMELTTTFGVEPDLFALNANTSEEPATLVVRLGDHEILKETRKVAAGVPIRVAPVPGIDRGLNEFFVEAGMSTESSGKSFALRLRLMRDGLQIAEKTFWSEGENKIAGTFQVNIEEGKTDGDLD